MKSRVLILTSCLLVACTTVKKQDTIYSTIGKAHVLECDNMQFPQGFPDPNDPNKPVVGTGCRKYDSDGMSGEFASIVMACLNIIPGLPALTSWINKL